MLFNSYIFLFLFLPIVLVGYYLFGKFKQPRICIIWLIAASLVFYGWANPVYVVLLIGSILLNYFLGIFLSKATPINRRKWLLALGITVNILLLAYFKYMNFFIDTANTLFNTSIQINSIVLPVAISFFTIQQIAYLVDLYRGEPREHGFWDYMLFVSFFPKLLSGPIVRMKQMMPQLASDFKPKITPQVMAVGLTILILGLFKKVIIADSISSHVDPVFSLAANGSGVSFFNAWIGALAYSIQIYFDFSGYCDVAIGLGMLFGIRLPLNFYSPYKATGIIDFWRRWHMTLSSFVRDYLYIPFGGNRHGFWRQMISLLLAMAIIGFWHGAGWTFLIWGTLHGLYLVINHTWRKIHKVNKPTKIGTMFSIFFTFIAVTVAWVFFRADSVNTAKNMLEGMIGLNGFHLPDRYLGPLSVIGQLLVRIGVTFDALPEFSYITVIFIMVCLFIIWFLPNAQEYMSNYQPSLDNFNQATRKPLFSFLRWKPSLLTAIGISCILTIIILGLNHVTQFIYFQF